MFSNNSFKLHAKDIDFIPNEFFGAKNSDRKTPLLCYLSTQEELNYETIKLLIDKKSDINFLDYSESNAFHYLFNFFLEKETFSKIIKLFLYCKGNPNTFDYKNVFFILIDTFFSYFFV